MPSDELKAQIVAAATEAMPHEMCGFVVNDKGKPKFVQCDNQNKHVLDEWGKPTHFKIGADDFEKHDEHIVWVVHSHVFVKPEAFDHDKSQAESAELPFLIVSVPTNQFGIYIPSGWKAPLLNRTFVYGIHDCWHLVKDYYAEKLNIELPDFDYPEDWWKNEDANGKAITPQDLMTSSYKEAGFVKVNDLQVHDLILMTLRSDVCNHVAIFVGDGMIMHHVAGRLSTLQPYVADRGYYSQNAQEILRHKTLIREEDQP